MSRWFRALASRPNAHRRLVIVPHAGGGPAFYRAWAGQIPDDVEPVAVLLPGRDSRWKEPPLTRMEPMIIELARELQPLFDLPVTLFGHSLGAIIAYELARRMPVEALTVAGARAPQLPRFGSSLHDLSEPSLRQELKCLGGTPSEVLDNEELFGLFLPTMRADLELMETYWHSKEPQLSVPTMVYGGFADERVPLADLLPWQNVNGESTNVTAIIGGHFFVKPTDLFNAPSTKTELVVVPLKREADVVENYRQCLDDSELLRANRFLRSEHRDRFIICRGVLRHMLGQRLGVAPRDVDIVLSPSGKPHVQDSDIRFNLSHSDDLALILTTFGQEVGVDIERIRSDVDHAGLSERYFSPLERANVLAASGQERAARFFAYWSAKEAYSKARGLGLNLPLDEYDIHLDEFGNPCGVTDRTLPAGVNSWSVAGIHLAPGFAAAISSEVPITQLRLLRV